MATNNQVGVGLSGSTGTGAFVGSTSAVMTTPTIGAATATSVIFNPTTGGIIGTTTNDDTGTGKVGEFISSVVSSSSPTSINTITDTNLTNVSLTAGDWDVWANIGYVAQATTNIVFLTGWTSTTSATQPGTGEFVNRISFPTGGSVLGNVSYSFNVPVFRYSLSATTTIYLSGRASFSVDTLAMYGGLYARRRR